MSILEDLKLQYKIGGIGVQLIMWNVLFFLVSIPLFYQFKSGFFDFPEWICLSSKTPDLILRPWTLLSYAFLHVSFWHLLFNVLVLNFSSRLFLTFFTQKQFLGLYILATFFAGLIFVIAFNLIGYSGNIVGASAAIMSILVGVTTYQPLMDVRLLLIGNVKLWHITAVVLLLDLLEIGFSNTGGNISHFAGAFFGFVYLKQLESGRDLASGLNKLIDWFSNLFSAKKKATSFKKVYRNPKPTGPVNKIPKVVTKDKSQQQIDEILDKIGRSGYDSLTAAEKDFLFKAGKSE
jgi:membrane associated rhomboid family serine protease